MPGEASLRGEAYELLYHAAMPGKAKVAGLDVFEVPECEGGGVAFKVEDARRFIHAGLLHAQLSSLVYALAGEQEDQDEIARAFDSKLIAGEVGKAQRLLKELDGQHLALNNEERPTHS